MIGSFEDYRLKAIDCHPEEFFPVGDNMPTFLKTLRSVLIFLPLFMILFSGESYAASAETEVGQNPNSKIAEDQKTGYDQE